MPGAVAVLLALFAFATASVPPEPASCFGPCVFPSGATLTVLLVTPIVLGLVCLGAVVAIRRLLREDTVGGLVGLSVSTLALGLVTAAVATAA